MAIVAGMPPFLLAAVYNYPQTQLQAHVWQELIQISNNYDNSWLVTDDLNNILHKNEKKGGPKPLL